MHILEEFVVVDAPMTTVDAIMTERELMDRWVSPAVKFTPLDGWSFEQDARWKLTLTGLGDLLVAHYIVHERKPGLILWAYNGFWEGFDAWHWFPNPDNTQQTIIQNRLEYELRTPVLGAIWPLTVEPFMKWDAREQMKRLKRVCAQEAVTV